MFIKFKFIFLILVSNIYLDRAQNLTFKAHNSIIRGIKFTNDNKVISTSDDQVIKIWDPMKNWTLLSSFKNSNSAACCGVSYLTKFGLFAVANRNTSSILNLAISNFSLIKTFKEHSQQINALAINSNNILATGSSDCKIKIWSLNSNNSLLTLILLFK